MAIEDEIFDFYDRQNRGFGPLDERPWKAPRTCVRSRVPASSAAPSAIHASSSTRNERESVNEQHHERKNDRLSVMNRSEIMSLPSVLPREPSNEEGIAADIQDCQAGVPASADNQRSRLRSPNHEGLSVHGIHSNALQRLPGSSQSDRVSHGRSQHSMKRLPEEHGSRNGGHSNIKQDPNQQQQSTNKKSNCVTLQSADPLGQPSARRKKAPSASIRIPGPAGKIQREISSLAVVSKETGLDLDFDFDFDSSAHMSPDTVDGQCSVNAFRSGPWLSAMDVLDATCSSNGEWTVPWIVLGSIRAHGQGGRVPQVVGIIDSFEISDFGDAYVTLKDHTAAINGVIPERILRDEDMAKNLTLGAVLILKNPVVFSPISGSQYLNVTEGNISHVFPADAPVPGKFSFLVPSVNVLPGQQSDEDGEDKCHEGRNQTESLLDGMDDPLAMFRLF